MSRSSGPLSQCSPNGVQPMPTIATRSLIPLLAMPVSFSLSYSPARPADAIRDLPAELRHQAREVPEVDGLRNQAIRAETGEGGALDTHGAAGGGQAEERPAMRASHHPAGRGPLPADDQP